MSEEPTEQSTAESAERPVEVQRDTEESVEEVSEEIAKELAACDPCEVLNVLIELMGGQYRDGQAVMVDKVYQALVDSQHIMVQAGTGTGKSFGYLVPALTWAAFSGQRAIVSTATLALQRQIMTSDAPAVVQAIAQRYGKHVEVALLKGWNNYACMRRVQSGSPDEDSLISRDEGVFGASAVGEEVVRARQWALSSSTGDRDDLVPGVGDRVWQQISVSKQECVGTTCLFAADCFAMQARAAAQEADLVVTNHALLGIETTGTPVMPQADAYIIDEAHDLVERVTTQLTRSLSHFDLASFARLLRQAGLSADSILEIADDIDAMFNALPVERLTEIPDGLREVLTQLLGSVQEALSDIAGMPQNTEDATAQKKRLRVRAMQLADFCTDCLSEAVTSGSLVAWLGEYGEVRTIYLAPLDVSGRIARTLFAERPAILTSATLHLGGSFDAMAHKVGFSYPEQGPWEGIDVGSPFTPHRQGILYVAAHLPPPGQGGYDDVFRQEIVDLIQASQGGALCLFTSKEAAQRAADYVRPLVDTPVLCQGDDQLSTLIEQFESDYHASLFGVMSLWQGVDVPGDTNRLVIIDRIPFPRPNEPLTQARCEAAERAGRNAFMAVSVPQAALLLAQGAGRLLRRTTDRGVVAVLDSRLRYKRYAGYLIASMPQLWRTVDRDYVLEQLSRLARSGQSRQNDSAENIVDGQDNEDGQEDRE
ncbi:ATP-dependent DNA helicase [Trueperella sp. LYQ143]|uniref:ATP-dependent DNA helicase n=1 Tax=unclassified Trueperella TaxID=2630174 RepID=UPI003982F34C